MNDAARVAHLKTLTIDGAVHRMKRDRPIRWFLRRFIKEGMDMRQGRTIDIIVDILLYALTQEGMTLNSAAKAWADLIEDDDKQKAFKKSRAYELCSEFTEADVLDFTARANVMLAGLLANLKKPKTAGLVTDEFFGPRSASRSRFRGNSEATTKAGRLQKINKLGHEVLDAKKAREGRYSQYVMNQLLGHEKMMTMLDMEGERMPIVVGIDESVTNRTMDKLGPGQDAREYVRHELPGLSITHRLDGLWDDYDSLVYLKQEERDLHYAWLVKMTMQGRDEALSDGYSAQRRERQIQDGTLQKSMFRRSVGNWSSGNVHPMPGCPDVYVHVEHARPFADKEYADLECILVYVYEPIEELGDAPSLSYHDPKVPTNMRCRVYATSGPPDFVFDKNNITPSDMRHIAQWAKYEYKLRWGVEIAIHEHNKHFRHAPSDGEMRWRLLRQNFWAFVQCLAVYYRAYDESQGRKRLGLRYVIVDVMHVAIARVMVRWAAMMGYLEEFLSDHPGLIKVPPR